jgi:hypothetical protein
MGQKERPLKILIFSMALAEAQKSLLVQFLSVWAAAPNRERRKT